jgi:DNA-binding XRE family transcriptional regulator
MPDTNHNHTFAVLYVGIGQEAAEPARPEIMAALAAMTLGERIKIQRERAGLSQQQLATLAGLSVSMVSQLEQGKKPDPRLSTVLAIADALDVSIIDIVTGAASARKGKRK